MNARFIPIFMVYCSCLLPNLVAQNVSFDSSYTNTYYLQKSSHFRSLPTKKGATIFLGDSITDMGEWWEIRGNNRTLNRGISSDITFGLLARIDEVIRHEPDTVFILIGINDIARQIPETIILQNMRRMIDSILKPLPNTEVVLQTVLPTNPAYPQFRNHQGREEQILVVNEGLSQLAAEYQIPLIDLHHHFADDQGFMKDRFTDDGLHLNGEGYAHWNQLLRQEGF